MMEIIKLAFRNLLKRKVRSFLTIFGVLIAVGFTVGLLSVSEGLIVSTTESTSRQKEQILVLPKETTGQPLPMLEAYGSNLPENLKSDIEKIANVKKVYPVFVQTLAQGQKLTSFMSLNGLTADYIEDLRPHFKLKEGRFLEAADKDVVLLGQVAAKERDLKTGAQFKIKNKELKVVGILESSGGMLGFEDMLGYLPLQTLQKIYESEDRVTFFAVTVSDVEKAKETAQEISEKIEGGAAQTTEDTLKVLSDWIKTARSIHFIIASFALLIGILFVLSTMMMSVSERTKEIGTLRALGASPGFIFRLILSESLIIGILAGALGCLVGFGLSKVITLVAYQALELEFIQTEVTPRIFAIGIGVAVLIGTLSGLYPAWRISKTNIVSALKYE